MIQTCKDCQKKYDVTKQSSLCPHKEHFTMCKKHNRVLCGMPECQEQGGNNDNSDRGYPPNSANHYSKSTYGG